MSKKLALDLPLYDFSDKKYLRNDLLHNMLKYLQSMFKWSGLPDTMSQRMLELMLMRGGYVGFTEVDDKYYVFNGGLGGTPDVYYEPTELIVANPALNFNKSLTIDKDVVIINNDSLRLGLLDILNMYATLLTENYITLRISDINSRAPVLISASDDSTKASADLFIKNMEDGKLSIIGENAFFNGLKVSPYSSSASRSITDLLEYHNFLRAGWLNDLGIKINNNMKRESLTDDEICMADDQVHPLVDDMLEQRRIACDKINKMYGLSISVDFNSSWKELKAKQELDIKVCEDPNMVNNRTNTDGGGGDESVNS